MRATREGTATCLLGLVCVAAGVSYIVWGNWIPIGTTLNNPTAAGVYTILVGLALMGVGVALARMKDHGA